MTDRQTKTSDQNLERLKREVRTGRYRTCSQQIALSLIRYHLLTATLANGNKSGS